jgi:hypothetical protein
MDIYEWNKLIVPQSFSDFIENNLLDEYNGDLFNFYSIENIKPLKDLFFEGNGIPKFSDITKTVPNHESCFIFADYMFCMFSYGICLYQVNTDKNEVYVICGNQYKLIANSFSEFVELYNNNAIELQMG